MDYKNKLQTNNTALEGNNLDLQTILNTINSLPEAGSGESVNLDDEIIAQDTVIAQIQSALEGKAVGGGNNTDVDTCTINFWNDIIGSGGTSVKFIVTCFNEDGKTSISNTGELLKMDNASIPNVIRGSLALAIPVSGLFSTTSYKIYINEDIVENIANTQYHYFTIPNDVNTEINISLGI